MPSEKMWAIVGKYGLYTGTWFTRREAIVRHCRDLSNNPDIGMTWQECRKRGDRAIRVTMTWGGKERKP